MKKKNDNEDRKQKREKYPTKHRKYYVRKKIHRLASRGGSSEVTQATQRYEKKKRVPYNRTCARRSPNSSIPFSGPAATLNLAALVAMSDG